MPHIIVKLGDKIVKNFPVTKDVVSVGRAKDNDIVLENLSVSRNHARIRREGEQMVLVDLNSANGVFVNGVRVSRAELVDGDIVSIGKHRLHYSELSQVGPAMASGAAVPLPATPIAPAGAEAPVPVTSTAIPKEAVAVEAPSTADAELFARLASGELIAVLDVVTGRQAGRAFALPLGETTIGRHNCAVRLHDMGAARKHANISWADGQFILRDLGSWKGTRVNGEKVREKALRPGDDVRIGETLLRFLVGEPDEFAERFQVQVPEPEAPPPPAPPAVHASSSTVGRRPSAVIPQPAIEAEDEDLEFESGFDSEEEDDEPVRLAVDQPTGSGAADIEDDEFAPLSEEELAELEREADEEFSHTADEELARRAEWEQLEAEKLLHEGGGIDFKRTAALLDDDSDLRAQEEAAVRDDHGLHGVDDSDFGGHTEVPEMDEQEERSLFQGPVEDIEPGSRPAPVSDTPMPRAPEPAPVAVAPPAPVAAPAVAAAPRRDSTDTIPIPPGVDANQVRRWYRGLKNKNKLVRREAAKKLKELTGQDYDWESEPE
ncbi:MAG: FHA domain-containing protein [Candidatus Sumerlaeia bacterium]|nr:FHA domain-containing protein [Candidatus Sumerlaeia bacterium]